MTPQIPRMNGMNKNEQFFKSSKMSQNRSNWVGIDLTSVPAKFGGPGTLKDPKSLSQVWFQKSGYFGRKVGTVLEHGHCDGSRRARAFKLCRDTC